MKKVSLVLLMMVGLLSTSLFAQTGEKQASEFKNVVGVSPFAFWHGLRLKYERVLTPKLTVGSLFTGYYGQFPGVQIAPVGRYYFKHTAPKGFYGQAKLVGGYYSCESSENFTSFGFGAAVGYQTLFTKNDKWTFDFNLGLKLSGIAGNSDGVTGLSWVLWGPGSWIDGLVSIGYRF
jgi:hypothetical protein